MIKCKNICRKYTNNITLKAANYTILQSDKLKVLGIYFTAGLNQQANINNIISKIIYRFMGWHVLAVSLVYLSIRILSAGLVLPLFQSRQFVLMCSSLSQWKHMLFLWLLMPHLSFFMFSRVIPDSDWIP